jgi:hypothetical protein
MSHANLDSSPFPQVSSFHDIYTLGTMCNLSLGYGRHIYTHFVPFFKKKMHVHVVLKFWLTKKL